MTDDNVIKLVQPGSFEDPLTEVLRIGARTLLAQTVEVEVAEFLAKHANLKTQEGCQRVVRRGYCPGSFALSFLAERRLVRAHAGLALLI